MDIKEISSLQHPLVKHLARLRESRALRNKEKKVLIAGFKQVSEAALHTPLLILLIDKQAHFENNLNAAEVYFVSTSLLKKITGLENPEPIAAVIPFPTAGNLHDKKFILCLDGIQDPGNLGTLLRSALALGWEGIFLTENSVDPFNDKALRAAKGATFRIPIASGTYDDLEKLIKENGLHPYVADAKGKKLGKEQIKTPTLLILGSESKGVSDSLRHKYPAIAIPIAKEMESLNVGAAGAILMYEMRSKA